MACHFERRDEDIDALPLEPYLWRRGLRLLFEREESISGFGWLVAQVLTAAGQQERDELRLAVVQEPRPEAQRISAGRC